MGAFIGPSEPVLGRALDEDAEEEDAADVRECFDPVWILPPLMPSQQLHV